MLIWIILNITLLALISSTVTGYLGFLWWIFDIFSHFRVQYFSIGFGLALIFILTGKTTLGWIAGIMTLLNLGLILPLYFVKKKVKISSASYTLLLANVNTANSHHEKVKGLIKNVSPDLIVLVEVDDGWLDDLGLKELGYRFSISDPRGDNYGIAMYSKVALISREVRKFGQLGMPSLVASLYLGGELINLIGSHPPPPKSGQLSMYRDQQIAEIMDFTREIEGEVIFCGDINMTSWSPIFPQLLDKGNMIDTRVGFGVQPTWPTWMPLFYIPLDHIWVSGNIEVHNRKVGPRVGSDHLPVILNFSIGSHGSNRVPG